MSDNGVLSFFIFERLFNMPTRVFEYPSWTAKNGVPKIARRTGVKSAVFVHPNLATAVVPMKRDRKMTISPVDPDSMAFPVMVESSQNKLRIFL